jgi:ubiquinone/menaquinone biosynthesis C-methylase UbiE
MVAGTLEAYEQWAPLYPPEPHNPLMRVEQATMRECWPEIAGRRALDLASGSGRYSQLLAASHAAEVVAVDFCLPMLARASHARRVCASMMQLPFADATFDVAIAGLALGHAADLQAWMTEVSRVLTTGGTLLYSDFHPEAARVGLTRSFHTEKGQSVAVPHHPFDLASQKKAIAAANMTIDIVREIRVGRELHEPFAKSEEFYRRWDGLPIALIIRAHT